MSGIESRMVSLVVSDVSALMAVLDLVRMGCWFSSINILSISVASPSLTRHFRDRNFSGSQVGGCRRVDICFAFLSMYRKARCQSR